MPKKANGRRPRVGGARTDPSRTTTLRRRWETELRRGFARVRAKLLVWLAQHTTTSTLVGNAVGGRWAAPDARLLEEFRKWLVRTLGLQLNGADAEEVWRAYVEEGYRLGAGRAFDDAGKATRALAEAAGDEQALAYTAGGRARFLESTFGRPVSVERVKVLAGRALTDLRGVTDTAAAKMTRLLADGLVRGLSPREVARQLRDEVGIAEGRALAVARTETVRAHAEGQLEALEGMGVEEVGVAVEWSTVGDERVCELCAPLETVVLKLAEARGLLPRHPNCRCAWIPANVGEDAKQKDTKRQIESAFRKAGLEDETVSKDRPKSVLNVRFRDVPVCPLEEYYRVVQRNTRWS